MSSTRIEDLDRDPVIGSWWFDRPDALIGIEPYRDEIDSAEEIAFAITQAPSGGGGRPPFDDAAIPVPPALGLMLLALAGLGVVRRR